MEVDIKQTQIDGIVKSLQSKSFDVTKALASGALFEAELRSFESELKKLRQAQKRPDKNTKEVDRKFFDWRPFMKWLKANDFPNIDDFEIVYNPETGHGIATKKDLKADELILTVPLKFMMTNKTAIESKIALLLHNDQLLQGVYSLSLALHLLVEKRTMNSFWGPYIDSLPRKVPNSPLFWDFDKIIKLRGTHAFEELVKFKVSYVKAYCHIYSRLEKQLESAVMKRANFTYDSFGWAYTITYSRQNQIFLKGANDKPVPSFALIPFFDLLNHDNCGKITTHYILENECLETRAIRDFSKGEEIKIFYGTRPNVELFINSGFVMNPNPYNYTTLSFSLAEKDKFKTQKTEILQKHELPPSGKFAMHIATPLQEELLNFMKIAWINNEEDLKLADRVFKNQPISLQNEITVYTMLELKTNQVLSSFPTTIEEDKNQMEIWKQKGAMDEVLICQLLIDEKSILREANKMAQQKKQKNLQKKAAETTKKT